MDELIALATLPRARLPQAGPGRWLRILSGREAFAGEPIPEGELDIPAVWVPLVGRIGPDRASRAAQELLNWLFAQARGGSPAPLVARDPDATQALLSATESLDTVFAMTGELVDFRPTIAAADRTALCTYLAGRYRPPIRR